MKLLKDWRKKALKKMESNFKNIMVENINKGIQAKEDLFSNRKYKRLFQKALPNRNKGGPVIGAIIKQNPVPEAQDEPPPVITFDPMEVKQAVCAVMEPLPWSGLHVKQPEDLKEALKGLEGVFELDKPREQKLHPGLQDIMAEFNIADVIATITECTPLRKAAGPSGVTPEMTVYLPDDVMDEYARLLVDVLHTKVPESMKRSQIWPIPKGDQAVTMHP